MKWNFDPAKQQWSALGDAWKAARTGYGAHWNGALGIGIGAALLTPWALSSDDRGYARTSLLTTPLLAAGLVAGPGLWSGLQYAGQRAKETWRAAPDLNGLNVSMTGVSPDLRHKTPADFKVLLDKGEISQETFNDWSTRSMQLSHRAEQEKYLNFAKRKGEHDVPGLNKSVSSLWTKRMTEFENNPVRLESFQREMNAALHQANLAAGLNTSQIGNLPLGDVYKHLESYGGLAPEKASMALRTMKRRLTLAGRHVVGEAAPNGNIVDLSPQLFNWRDKDSSLDSLGEGVAAQFRSHFSEAEESGRQISLAFRGDQMLGYQISHAGKSAMIGFVNPNKGSTLIGSNLSQTAVAHPVRAGGSQVEYLDTWMAKNWRQSIDKQKYELATHTQHAGIDFEDAAWATEFQADRGSALLNDRVIRYRSRTVKPSTYSVYADSDNKLTTFDRLDPKARARENAEFGKVAGGFGNEAGVSHGNGVLRSQLEYFPGGEASEKKANYFQRSLDKTIELDPSTIPDALRSRYTNERLAEDFAAEGDNAAGFLIGKLTPQQVSFFGELPANPAELRNPAIEARAKAALHEDLRAYYAGFPEFQEGEMGWSKLDASSATQWAKRQRSAYVKPDETQMNRQVDRAWRAMRDRFERNPLDLHAARKMASAGETEFILHSQFGQMMMRQGAVAHVSSFHLRDHENNVLKPNQLFSGNQVIGYAADGSEVVSPAGSNLLTHAEQTPTGWNVHYTRYFPVQTSSKIDDANKSLVVKLGKGEMESNLGVLNLMHKLTGRGTPFSKDIKALVNAQFYSHKENAVLATYGMAYDTLARLHKVGAKDLHKQYFDRFRELDLHMDDKVTENTSSFLESMAEQGMDLQQVTADRLEKVQNATHELLTDTQRFVEANPKVASQDNMFRHFLKTKRPDMGLHVFMENYSLPMLRAHFWNSTEVDVPHQVSVTHDMYTNMLRAGDHEAFDEILRTSEGLHGDTVQATNFLDNLINPEQFSKKPSGKIVPLGTPEEISRMFDEDRRLAENYSVDLGKEFDFVFGEGDRAVKYSRRYLPIMGDAAYKGMPNVFGANEEAARKWQYAAMDTLKAAAGGNAELFQARHSEYAAKMSTELLGKKGVLSPTEYHPNAMALFATTRPSPDGNPWNWVVSRDQLHRLRDPNLREALKNAKEGESVIAKAARHPVSYMPYVKVRLGTKDDHLGPNQVGMPMSARSIQDADNDGDTINLMFAEVNGAMHNAGIRAINDPNSLQNHILRAVDLMQGNEEDSAKVVGKASETFGTEFFQGSLKKNLDDLIQNARHSQDNIANRMAHAETGLYSNLLTRLHMNLSNHPTVQDPFQRQLLEQSFFEIRQVPISAAKGKTWLGQNPRKVWEAFQTSMTHPNADEGVRIGKDAFTRLLLGTGKTQRILNDSQLADAKNMFGVTHSHLDYETGLVRKGGPVELKVGSSVNIAAESVHAGTLGKTYESFLRGRDRRVDNVLGAVVREEVKPEQAIGMLKALGHDDVLGTARTGRMAEVAASDLGAINSAWSDVRGVLGKALKPGVPLAATGLGLAAVAGFLGTNISSHRHRPETTAGQTDRPPEDPVEGSLSNRPRVRQTAAPAQVKTMRVVPVNSNKDLEVRASAPDRSAAVEAARVVAKMKGMSGRSNVTVNYHGGARDRMSKLRMQQELRENMDLNDV